MRFLQLSVLLPALVGLAGCGGGGDAAVVADQSELETYVANNAEAVANLEAFEAEAEMEEEEDE